MRSILHESQPLEIARRDHLAREAALHLADELLVGCAEEELMRTSHPLHASATESAGAVSPEKTMVRSGVSKR